jgi:hypothetical protein
MEHRYGTAELRLNGWIARHWETNVSQFPRVAGGMLVFVLGNGWCHQSGA